MGLSGESVEVFNVGHGFAVRVEGGCGQGADAGDGGVGVGVVIHGIIFPATETVE